MLRGLALFIGQRRWQTWVPWVLPALLPLFFGAFPGVGSFVHDAYLKAFDTDAEAVGVSAVWQLYAATRWGALVLILLFGPALYGYARHFHLSRLDRIPVLVTLLAVLFALCDWGTTRFVLGPAAKTGTTAVSQASSGNIPSSYYGIEPEWVCVAPLAGQAAEEIPVQGGAFEPARPLLHLGASGGNVVLWDTGADRKSGKDNRTLTLPLSRLRISPTDDPRGTCGASGRQR
ncbi:hypothetical protein [Streptomyces sp. NPDC050145]|uniref:hypothetical protein n=1 Tax=Streptomyces sp. NPDC050145 TaxID=3365602 RepID=UPI0037991713